MCVATGWCDADVNDTSDKIDSTISVNVFMV